MTIELQATIIIIANIIANIIVTIILSRQIKSQKAIIKDLHDYIKTLSWREVKEFYDQYKIPSEKDIARFQLIKEYGRTPEEHEDLVNDYNELLNYFYTVMKGLNGIHPNFAKDKILMGLPRNAKYFRDIWEGG